MNVLVSTSSFGRISSAPLEALERAGLSVRTNPHGRVLAPEESRALMVDVDALIAGTERLDRETLLCAPDLKIISRVGSGVETIDLEAARELGIAVATTPEPPAQAVAELALAGILASLRRLRAADRDLRSGRWVKPMGRLLAGKSVGVIGTGRAGRRLARLLAPFQCELLACDLERDVDWAASQGVRYVELEPLLESADVVSLHVPLTDSTRGLIDRTRIERMKPGAVLVNCARGGLVDEAALAENLASGRLGGAYLDVFEAEPYSGPLLEAPNTLLTPHIGSYAAESRLRMELEAAEAVIERLAGGEQPG